MSKNTAKNNSQFTASANGIRKLEGNSTTLSPEVAVQSVYQGQAISDCSRVEDEVPMVNDANVKRERNWSVENKK